VTHHQLTWQRSTACANGSCVEVASDPQNIYVRDSKNPDQAALAFTREEWHAFVVGVQRGEFLIK
jgi:predicted secreted Zn-dependent protease